MQTETIPQKKWRGSVLPPFFIIKNNNIYNLLEDLPPYRDKLTAKQKVVELKQKLETVYLQIVPHQGRYFIYHRKKI